MKICFVVDYRSAIARNWIEYFIQRGHEVHVVSTFPLTDRNPGLSSCVVYPVGLGALSEIPLLRRLFSSTGSSSSGGSAVRSTSGVRMVVSTALRRIGGLADVLVPIIGPPDARRVARRLRQHLASLGVDIVHAMRIPLEGMLATEAAIDPGPPTVVSIWGNDLTLWAGKNPMIAEATRRTLRRAEALHTDCFRDRRLAEEWDWDPKKPSAVIPGSGGVQMDWFTNAPPTPAERSRWNVPAGRPVVFNPRSFRPSYVRSDVFFEAVRELQSTGSRPIVACVAMQGNDIAEQWRASLPDPESVRLLPRVSREEMAVLFRLADVTVSASLHDGTPNTLLEGMASGAFPVAGDIESVREWITDGVNGLLCDPNSVPSLTAAMRRALDDADLRARASQHNRELISARAEYDSSMRRAEAFYQQVVEATPRRV